jgi:hypothetical protein
VQLSEQWLHQLLEDYYCVILFSKINDGAKIQGANWLQGNNPNHGIKKQSGHDTQQNYILVS